jgi:SAM-dependent methyltransferase
MLPTRTLLLRHANSFAPTYMKGLRTVRDFVRAFFARDIVKDKRKRRLISEPWIIDSLFVSESGIEVTGWAFPPSAWIRVVKPAFRLNGEPFSLSTVGVPRPDVAAKFWQREDAELSGFSCKSTVDPYSLFRDGFLEISYLNSPAHLPSRLKHSWFYWDPRKELPLPSSEQRFRVIGNGDEFGFLLSGATDFMRLAWALTAITKRAFGEFESVLDWGSGCGRIARYAAPSRSGSLVGCDVDAENVKWCNENLPGKYFHTDMRPPLRFGDGEFDLVYGVSVFTHFREELQDAWLSELRRIVRPRGIVMVTTHGQTAIDFAGLRPTEFVALQEAVNINGHFTASKNDQLDGAVDSSGEYVNVFHSTRYLRKHWSEWFEVLAIVPGYIYTHDLVILRRRI